MSKLRAAFWALACYAVAVAQAAAQSYPSKPISLVIGVAAGGPSDIVTRVVAKKMGEELSQSVLVVNRPGGAGTVAGGFVARSAPDGYTLYLGSSTALTMGPAVSQDLGFDPDSLVVITDVYTTPLILEVNQKLPVKDLGEFLQYLKANRGKPHYGSAGVNTPAHMATLLLSEQTGTQGTHVPYKSGTDAALALVRGDIEYLFDVVVSSSSFIESKQFRVLAVTGPRRSRALPEVPTFAELGYPNMTPTLWGGILAPPGTPQAVVDKIQAATKAALASDEVKEFMNKNDMTPGGNSAAAFSSMIGKERDMWKGIAAKFNLKQN